MSDADSGPSIIRRQRHDQHVGCGRRRTGEYGRADAALADLEAQIDTQMGAVLGPGKSGEGRFEDAARYLEKLFLDGLKP